MLNKKCLFVNFVFGCLSLFIIYIALTGAREQRSKFREVERKTTEVSLFKNVYYFQAYDFTPSLILESDNLEIKNDILFTFVSPRGKFYEDNVEYRYEANDGILDKKIGKLWLTGDVRLSNQSSDYASDKLRYDFKKDIVNANGNVSAQFVDEKTLDIIKVKSQSLVSYIKQKFARLTGNVRGNLKRKRIYEGGFRFSSEVMELNSLKSQMDLLKDVKIHKNTYDLEAEKAEVFLENYNKKLKYYVLYDDVKLEQAMRLDSGRVQMRRAYAEKLESIQSAGKVILTGAPRVEQGADVIKGYQITLRENTELIEVDDAQSSFQFQKE